MLHSVASRARAWRNLGLALAVMFMAASAGLSAPEHAFAQVAGPAQGSMWQRATSRARAGLSAFRSAIGRSPEQMRERARVERVTRVAERRAARGELNRAVSLLERLNRANLRGRNARTVRRAETNVRRTAIDLLRQRSRVGDIEGSHESSSALNRMSASGRLGGRFKFTNRWHSMQADQAQRQALRRIMNVAVVDARNGRSEQAFARIQYAAGDLHATDRDVRSGARQTYREAMNTASLAAKHGDYQTVASSLQLARELAGGLGQFESFAKKADKLTAQAAARAPEALIQGARQAYKEGNVQQAAHYLLEARRFQQHGPVRLSRSARRAQRKLERLLLTQMSIAAQEQAAGSAPTGVTNEARLANGNSDESVNLMMGARAAHRMRVATTTARPPERGRRSPQAFGAREGSR